MRACQLISEGIMRPPALIARPGFPRRDARPSPSRDMPSLCRWYGQRSGLPSSTCCRISIRSPPSPRNEVPRQLGHPSRAVLDDELSAVGQNLAELREDPGQEIGFRLVVTGQRMRAFDDPVDLVVYMLEKTRPIAGRRALKNASD